MKTIFYIARRYLFSKKSHNVINIISGISMAGVGIGTIALVVILSAFNGLDDLIVSMYSSFDPAIKISAKQGKVFNADDVPKSKILEISGVTHYTKVLEETVLVKYKDRQTIATLKGVESDFLEMTELEEVIVEGEIGLDMSGTPLAMLGYGLGYTLSLFIDDNFTPLQIHAAKRGKKVSMNPENAFKKKRIMPGSLFSINPDFDNKYIVVPFSFAQELFERESEISAIELGLDEQANPDKVKQAIQAIVGDKFSVKTRYELDELIFQTTKTEKWITYLILSFILVIATFNIIGSLTMLIIEKKDDILTLKSFGASKSMIKQIFLVEGIMISIVGGLCGLVLGVILVYCQQIFGFISLSGILIDKYPVAIRGLDLVVVSGTVLVIGFVSSWFPVQYAIKRHYT